MKFPNLHHFVLKNKQSAHGYILLEDGLIVATDTHGMVIINPAIHAGFNHIKFPDKGRYLIKPDDYKRLGDTRGMYLFDPSTSSLTSDVLNDVKLYSEKEIAESFDFFRHMPLHWSKILPTTKEMNQKVGKTPVSINKVKSVVNAMGMYSRSHDATACAVSIFHVKHNVIVVPALRIEEADELPAIGIVMSLNSSTFKSTAYSKTLVSMLINGHRKTKRYGN